MKLLTKHTDYAARALVYLSPQEDRYVPAREIAQNEDIPEYFLKRILQKLIGEGYLVAREGVKGGVRLNRGAADIRILDLVKLFQGGIELTACRVRTDPCPNRTTCLLRRTILNAQEKLLAEFEGLTIGSLLNAKHERKQ
jgi:Rrf2 family nitric oxide-sensitive transcriptional repressor